MSTGKIAELSAVFPFSSVMDKAARRPEREWDSVKKRIQRGFRLLRNDLHALRYAILVIGIYYLAVHFLFGQFCPMMIVLHLPCPGLTGIFLGGGYPEVYAKGLSENRAMLEQIRLARAQGIKILAECGGFLYLHETLEGTDGHFLSHGRTDQSEGLSDG